MTSEKQFDDFFAKLSFAKHINLEEKNKFYFLSYKNYQSRPITNSFIIYEDWWIKSPEVVKSKIISILKISKRIFARKCIVRKITKPIADVFLEENHIYGATKSKIKYGLFYEGILMGVATFAGQRQFHDGSRSVELLRYCNKNGYTIIGGLDKLLKFYIKSYQPDSIMTYIDLDWGNGNAFIKLGFEKKDIKPPFLFYVCKETGSRIPEYNLKNNDDISNYIKILNNGSVKLILPINT